MAQIYCTKVISARRHEVFSYMLDPDNFPHLLAQDIDVEVVARSGKLSLDAEYELQMTRYGLSQKVRLRIVDLVLEKRVAYKQCEGLFEKWSHAQVFETVDKDCTRVTDVVDYEMPFHFFGHILSDLIVKKDMTRVLENRLQQVHDHFVQESGDRDSLKASL